MVDEEELPKAAKSIATGMATEAVLGNPYVLIGGIVLFIAAALAFIFLEWGLINTRYRTLP